MLYHAVASERLTRPKPSVAICIRLKLPQRTRSSTDTFYQWSDQLLKLFLECRGIRSEDKATHDELVAQAARSTQRSISAYTSYPMRVLDLFTVQQLCFYLSERRCWPINNKARWNTAAPADAGRAKREALLGFAKQEYLGAIAGDVVELRKFDEDIAETLRQPILLRGNDRGRDVFLFESDIQVLYETWGLKLDPTWSRDKALDFADETAALLSPSHLRTIKH